MTSVTAAPSLTDRLLRVAATAAYQLLRAHWFVRRPRTQGAHALALTPQREMVLVKLRYARGWRLPGGGRDPGEDPHQAVIRELREEIGLTAHGRVTLASELDQRVDFKRDLAALLIVEDVEYRPRRFSWEIERVITAPLDALPADIAPVAQRWLAALRPHL